MNGFLQILGLAVIGWAIWRLVSRAVAEFAENYRLKDVIENRDPWDWLSEHDASEWHELPTVRRAPYDQENEDRMVRIKWDPSDIQYPDGSTIRSRRTPYAVRSEGEQRWP